MGEIGIRDNVAIWTEFVSQLKKGELTSDRIRPYHESLTEPILRFLGMMKEKALWEEFEAMPEFHQVGNQVHCLIPLTFNGERNTYCFTFLVEGGKWYFQHLESIIIRLDNVPSLPASTFPDLPEGQKAWMREEFRVSEQVRLFDFLSEEKGKDFAFDWFKDGAGYFLAARTWVPFVPAPKGFILFLCWEQANLRGNAVTLEKLEEEEAVLRMKSNYFRLFDRAAHLKQQISFEDYRRILETVWQDRANKAGWNLKITYEQEESCFHFTKTKQLRSSRNGVAGSTVHTWRNAVVRRA